MSNLCSPRRCSVPPSLCLKTSIRGMLGRLIRAMENYSCSPRRCSGRLYWRNSLSNASVQLCCVFVLVIQGLLLVVVILVGIALIKFAHGIVRGQISKSLAVYYVRDLREVIQRARTTVGPSSCEFGSDQCQRWKVRASTELPDRKTPGNFEPISPTSDSGILGEPTGATGRDLKGWSMVGPTALATFSTCVFPCTVSYDLM